MCLAWVSATATRLVAPRNRAGTSTATRATVAFSGALLAAAMPRVIPAALKPEYQQLSHSDTSTACDNPRISL
jgi:hypothetical protein